MIINIEDVKLALRVKDISIDDEKVHDLIIYYLNRIQSYTGLDFNIQTYHYTITNKKNIKKIVLPLYNIFDVDQVHVNYELYDDNKYFVDNKNGVIFFKNPLGYCEHIHVKYLVKIDDDIVSSILTPLVADMIIDGIENGGTDSDTGIGGEISSIHEGGVSISFKANSSLQDSINKRLDKLANGEISITGKQTKKGAYYI